MRLPIIKHLVEQDFDEDYFEETVEVLVSLADARGIKDEELDVIGELMSNMEGALEVKKLVDSGKRQSYYSKTNFSWDAMKDKLDEMLDTNLPKFAAEIELTLPELDLNL